MVRWGGGGNIKRRATVRINKQCCYLQTWVRLDKYQTYERVLLRIINLRLCKKDTAEYEGTALESRLSEHMDR